MQILIGNAWPYANGPLHIGHVASLLPGDVMARYHRAKGDAVFFVSGTDCHGTPVSVAAQKENKSPEEVSSAWHENFANSFRRLGFSYDRYGKTSGAEHVGFVRAFHRRLYESEYVFERETAQAFCETCGRFLPDRFLVGVCPECGAKTRGDQ
ncbi:MAG: class I tRNA ligase family protein, partial [Defluviitaleaceae bacterium]|nr:class I tRNA ligase family protein [Defluviitaleaceae bacterium]